MSNKNKPEDIDRNIRIMEKVEAIYDKQRHEIVLCLSVCFISTCVWMLLVALWEMLGRPIAEEKMTYGIEIIAVIMMHFILFSTDIRFANFGVNKKNLKRSIIRGLGISLVLCVLLFIYAYFKEGGIPALDLSEFTFSYMLTSILQEFLSRGVFFNCFLRIYTNRHGKLLAIVGSSLMFAVLHMFYGFYFMICALILSILLCIIYLYDDNIWGVSIVHYFVGTIVFVLKML